MVCGTGGDIAWRCEMSEDHQMHYYDWAERVTNTPLARHFDLSTIAHGYYMTATEYLAKWCKDEDDD
jgi:hypothetical protein